MISVKMAHRAPGTFRSIEELFTSIIRALPEGVKVAEHQAPASRARVGAMLANLRWAARLKACDLVHQTGDIHYAVLAIRHRPVVLTVHDLRFLEETTGLKRRFFRWLWLEWPCKRANRITVISDFTKNSLLGHCRVDPAKVCVIPNCVAEEFTPVFRPWPPRPRVLLVGTTPNKNLERVLRAAITLPVRWVVLGRMNEEQERMVSASGVEWESRHGLTRAEVVGLYQSCDLLCFISTYEGFGMPILEAQATGIPVVTSDLAPMVEVAGEGALKVNPFDEDAIREGIERLLSDGDLRGRLVEEGLVNVTKYSPREVAGQYAELYREVLNEH